MRNSSSTYCTGSVLRAGEPHCPRLEAMRIAPLPPATPRRREPSPPLHPNPQPAACDGRQRKSDPSGSSRAVKSVLPASMARLWASLEARGSRIAAPLLRQAKDAKDGTTSVRRADGFGRGAAPLIIRPITVVPLPRDRHATRDQRCCLRPQVLEPLLARPL